MARLRILWLPYVGEQSREIPFALVVDEVAPVRLASRGGDGAPSGREELFGGEAWRQFAAEIGARSVLVTNDRVDVVGDADDGLALHVDSTTFGQAVAEALRDHLGPQIRQQVDEWAADMVRDSHGEAVSA